MPGRPSRQPPTTWPTPPSPRPRPGAAGCAGAAPRDRRSGGRGLHPPEGSRRLVDRDEVGGIGGAEEECLPALRPRLDRGRVEAVGPARGPQAPEVEQGGRPEQREQRRSRPTRICGASAQQPVEAAGPVLRGRVPPVGASRVLLGERVHASEIGSRSSEKPPTILGTNARLWTRGACGDG